MDSGRKNFTHDEKECFFTIAQKYQDILDCKETNAYFLKEKHQTWEKIAREYSTSPLVTRPRTSVQLQFLYKNIKSKFRKDQSEENILKYLQRERLLKSREPSKTELTSRGTTQPQHVHSNPHVPSHPQVLSHMNLRTHVPTKPHVQPKPTNPHTFFDDRFLPLPSDCNDCTENYYSSDEPNDGKIEIEVANEHLASASKIDNNDAVTSQLPANPSAVSPELPTVTPHLKRNRTYKRERITEDSMKRKIFITKLRAVELEKINMEIVNKTVIINRKISEINLRKAQLELQILEKELAARERSLLANVDKVNLSDSNIEKRD